jgi:Tfp pilus assembly protein PilF
MAHVRLGSHCMNMALIGFATAAEMLPQARAAGGRALQLAPDLVEAHAFLGVVAHATFDWEGGARHFATAMAGEPLTPYVRGVSGLFHLYYRGQARTAVDYIRPALADDPLSVVLRHHLGTALLGCGRHEEGREQLREAVTLEPSFVPSWGVMAMSYWHERRIAEALDAAQHAHAARPSDPISLGLLAGILAQTGEAARGRELRAALDRPGYSMALGRAVHGLTVGDTEAAADAVEQSLAEHHPATLLYLRQPLAEPLRASPRWAGLAARMQLPDA